MIQVAAAINSFASAEMQADFVPPSDQLITLTYSQLQDLIKQAVTEAIQPLQDRIESLEDTVASLGVKIAALETTQLEDVDRICLDIAYDRQRLAKLEKVEPQPLQKDRAEILRALLVANCGKLLSKDARKKMHLSKERFSELLKICDFIETKPYHLDRRLDVIILKSELVPWNY